MRISDWSSDVCSSDLIGMAPGGAGDQQEGAALLAAFERGFRRAAPGGGEIGEIIQRRRIAGGLPGGLQQHGIDMAGTMRSEEHTSELQSLMRISYAVFCLKKNSTERNPTQ